jgi:DNA-binding HxlR family transcriptional regulator
MTMLSSSAPERHRHQEVDSAFCPLFHHAVELIGRRWSGAIVFALLAGRTRFTELAGAIPGISDRLLSERLKELEGEGIVERIVTPDTPVRIEYVLTTKGRDLAEVFDAVSAWALRWRTPRSRTRPRVRATPAAGRVAAARA